MQEDNKGLCSLRQGNSDTLSPHTLLGKDWKGLGKDPDKSLLIHTRPKEMDPFAFDFGQGMHGPGQSTANVPTPRTRLPDDPLPRATAESPEPLETLRNVEFLHRLPGLLPLDVSQLQQSSNSLSNRPSSRSRAVQRSIPSATIPPPTMADIASLFTSDMEDLSDDHNDDNSVSLHTASHSSLYGSDDNEDDDKGALTDLSLLSDEEVSRVNKVRVPRLPNGLGGRGRGRRRKRRSHRYSFQSRQKSQKTLGAGSIGQTPKNKSSPMHGGAPTPTNSTGPKHPRTTPFGHSTGSFTPHLNRPKPPFSSSLLLPPNPFTKRGEDKLKDERALNNDLDEIVKSRSVTFETVEVDQTEVVSETEKNDDNDDMPISPTHKGVKSTSDPDSKPHHSARLGLIDSTTKRTSSRTLQKPTPQLQPETHSQSAQELSDDNCAVCLGKGKLICCDSCVRVFHLGCLKEVLDEGALPDFWECWRCRGNRRRRKVKVSAFFLFSCVVVKTLINW